MTIILGLIIIFTFLFLFFTLIQKQLDQPKSQSINEECDTQNLSDKESSLSSDKPKVAIIEDSKISDMESDSQNLISSEPEKLFIDIRSCAKIYDSFLYNFYYHRNGIKIHLQKLESNSNSWDCELFFEKENISKKFNIPSWDKFLFVYIDSFLQDDLIYENYKSRIHSISYDLKIIMEIKSSLVMFKKTSSYKLYSLVNFDSSIKKYIMQICDVIFNDESESFESFDPLVDRIIDSVPPSFWDSIIAYKRFPGFSSNNIASLTSAFVVMFSTGYSDFGKHFNDSTILKAFSLF